MNRRRVVVATAISLGLVALVAFTEGALPRWQRQREDAERLLLARDAQPAAFGIERGGERGSLRKQSDGTWSIEWGEQRGLRADIRAISMLADALRGARVTAVVADDASGAVLAEHGLAPPRVTLSWTRQDGRDMSLALGRPALGGQVHARLGDRIVLVPLRLLEVADHGLDHFRAKRVLDVLATEIIGLDIERRADQIPAGASARLTLVRNALPGTTEADDVFEWQLVEPMSQPANPVRTASLLSRLESLQALGFGLESPDDATLAEAGLAPPVARLTLTRRDGAPSVLVLGDPSPEGNAWARAGSGPLVKVRPDVVRDALLADDFWRDNRVVRLPYWRVANVQIRKGVEGGLDLELAREPGSAWRIVRPADAPLDEHAATVFLEALEAMQCGRFEDELARDERKLDAQWNFDGPGSFDLSVLALMPDGSPRRADCELVPFVRDREQYFAVRTLDELGSVSACVAQVKAVDAMLDEARKIAALARPPAP